MLTGILTEIGELLYCLIYNFKYFNLPHTDRTLKAHHIPFTRFDQGSGQRGNPADPPE